MTRSLSSRLIPTVALLGSMALVGCSGEFSVPEPGAGLPAAPAQASSPSLSGTLYGGHAPIVGAHVFILAPSSTAFAGPGIAASSSNFVESRMCPDLTNNGLNVPCTATGTGNGAVSATADANGYHYVTTDNEGYFSLAGDYNCGVDAAIYLVAVGGSPSFPFSGGAFSYGISNVAVTTINTTTATFTFTTGQPPEEYYAGETITFSNFSGSLAGLNGQSGTVLADSRLTTTTFDVTLTSTIAGGTYSNLAGKATGTPQNNPAVINMAAAGLCPAAGTGGAAGEGFGDGSAGSINFIFMNEVSTTAMAYAMAGFGTDAFHIGVAAGGADTQYVINGVTGDSRASYTLDGMKEAIYDATNLYDVTGGNISTSFAGEGHIARTVTPGGNGAVPQATVDTIGNILAACVDSANANSATGVSPQCNVLFSNATNTGIGCTPGTRVGTSIYYTAPTCPTGTTAPTDIATAAFNIAHHPQGVNSNNFVNNLYTIPQGTLPFAPELTSCTSGTAGCAVSGQPGDFTIELAFTIPTSATSGDNKLNGINDMAIDGQPYVGGNHGASGPEPAIWIASATTAPIKVFTRTGIPDYTTNTDLAANTVANQQSVAIDYNNNVWFTYPANAIVSLLGNLGYAPEFTGGAPNTTGSGSVFDAQGFGLFSHPYGVVIDASANAYINNYNNTITQKLTKTGANASTGNATSPWSNTTNNYNPNNGFFTLATGGGMTEAIDHLGNLIETATFGALSPYYTTGANYGTREQIPSGGLYPNATQGYISVDHNNFAWATYPGNGIVGYSAAAGTETYNYGPGNGASIAGISTGCSTAVDGDGHIWIGNAGNASVSAITASGTALSSSTGQFGAPNSNTGSYAPLGTTQTCATPVIDRAGNVWLGFSGNNAAAAHLYKLVGAAAPIATPTSYQTFTNLLGVLP